MDFPADVLGWMRADLDAAGIAYDATEVTKEPRKFVVRWFDLRARRVEPARRGSYVSKELTKSPFYGRFRRAIHAVLDRSELGHDLRPFQSGQINHAGKPDKLLSDWRIQHFHLGRRKAGSEFCERTGQLLYATVLPNRVYAIQVMDHKSFSEIELLEIIEANWPDYLDRFTFKNLVDIEPVPTSSDIKTLRDGNVQSFVKLSSGRIIGPPGGGYSTAGTSTEGAEAARNLFRQLSHIEHFVKKHESDIRGELGIDGTVRIVMAEPPGDEIVLLGEGHTKTVRIPIAPRT